jgi:hypothetical protein
MNTMKQEQQLYTASVNKDHPQTDKKSRTWVWVLSGMLVLYTLISLIVLAFGVQVAINAFGGPTIVAEQYYSAIKDQDYARAYTYLDLKVAARMSKEAFITAARDRDRADGVVTTFTLLTEPDGDHATATIAVTRSHEKAYTVHLNLQKVGNEWKISAYDRL